MRPDRARILAAAAAYVGACALGGCARRDPPSAAGRAEAPRLAGVWAATFTLDAPPLGFDSAGLRRAPGGRVGGVIALLPNHWLSGTSAAGAELTAPPAVYGAYDVDFAAFGFDPRDGDRVPDVVGSVLPSGMPGRDSLVLVLGPTSDGGRVVLAGRARGDRGDSVVGTWRLLSEGRAGASAAGRFVLAAAAARSAAGLGAGLGARARAVLHAGPDASAGAGR